MKKRNIYISDTEPDVNSIWLNLNKGKPCLLAYINGKWVPVSEDSEGEDETSKIPIVEQTELSTTIEPNVYNVWGEVKFLDIELAEPKNPNIYNEYMMEFKSGESPTDLQIIGEDLKYIGRIGTLEPNTTYQVSIVNNVVVIAGV